MIDTSISLFSQESKRQKSLLEMHDKKLKKEKVGSVIRNVSSVFSGGGGGYCLPNQNLSHPNYLFRFIVSVNLLAEVKGGFRLLKTFQVVYPLHACVIASLEGLA